VTPETLDLAARYLRVLAAVERAHSIGSEDELISILAGVDPVDVRFVAQALESEQLSLDVRPAA
jgi:hypothetical protein